MRRRKDGAVVPDVAHRRAGRSAWVCPRTSCIGAAVHRRAFHRALAGPAKLAVREPVLAELIASTQAELADRLTLLRRSGKAPVQESALAALQLSLQSAGEVA